jgi:benzoyl-CoA reductase subunit C
MPAKATTSKGLATVEHYYQDYSCRVRELKKQGQMIMGYLSLFTPLEIITAAGMVPLRLKGNVREPITKADTIMETIVCPFVRSSFDMALKGKYEFLDGIVMPHTCDSVSRTYEIWQDSLKLAYNHFINVPHMTDRPSLEFFKAELNTFRKSLGRFTGKEISDASVARAIQAYNHNRAKMRELYELRKSDPPLLLGVEMLKVLVAAMSIPVEESTKLISRVVEEVKERKGTPAKKSPRIMIVGAQIDDTALMEVIEGSGASVVMDDLSVGSKVYWPDVDLTKDPVDGLAERYLIKIKHPRTYREKTGTYQENLAERFGHLDDFIRGFKVSGVILYIYKYCDPYGFEVPVVKSYIQSLGTPVLYLEDEYSMGSTARLKTRVQAFVEMIS